MFAAREMVVHGRNSREMPSINTALYYAVVLITPGLAGNNNDRRRFSNNFELTELTEYDIMTFHCLQGVDFIIGLV